MTNYELRVPNSPATRFHIASVSKPFTAMAILQLEEQGRLSISDLVSNFVPDSPNGDRIKLEHLLTHTSGIPNVNDLPDYDTFARSPHTIEQLVAKFSGLPLDFQPGSNYHYSNSNYNLLALILEKVSGESYGDYVRKHILDPARMQNTGHHGEALRLIPLSASGYEPSGIDSRKSSRSRLDE
jgi:CubicO group peptidase (beta-lactamase class C family)